MKNFILLLISILISLTFAEVLLEVFDLPPYSDHPQQGIYEGDNETGYVFKPNTKDWLMSYEYKTLMEINSIGLRDYNTITENSEPFIFAIGDSFVEGGHGLNIEKTIPKLLENKINKTVVNLGAGGYGTREEIFLYKRYLNKFRKKPKIALLFFYVGNDYFDNAMSINGPVTRVFNGYRFHKSQGGALVEVKGNTVRLLDNTGKLVVESQDREFHPWATTGWKFLDQTKVYNIIINGVHFLFLDKNPKCENFQISVPGLFNKKYKIEDGIEWRETKKIMLDFISISRETGIAPAVVIIPTKGQVSPQLFYNSGCGQPEDIDLYSSINVMKDFLNSEKIPYVDILNEMTNKIPSDKRLNYWFIVDSHLNPKGAEFVAESIKGFLADRFSNLKD